MKRTETARRNGRMAPMSEERNLSLLAVPAASTNGSTGRQQVKAAAALPTAESAAANAPFEEGLPVVPTASVFMDAHSSPLRANDKRRESAFASSQPRCGTLRIAPFH